MPLDDYESKYLEPGEHEVAIIACELNKPEKHTREKASIALIFADDNNVTHREFCTITKKAAYRLVKLAKAAGVPSEHRARYTMPWEPGYDPSIHARFWVRDPPLGLRITLARKLNKRIDAYMNETVTESQYCEIVSCRPIDTSPASGSAPAPAAKRGFGPGHPANAAPPPADESAKDDLPF